MVKRKEQESDSDLDKFLEDSELISKELEFVNIERPDLLHAPIESVEEWAKKAFPEELAEDIMKSIRQARELNEESTQPPPSPKDS